MTNQNLRLGKCWKLLWATLNKTACKIWSVLDKVHFWVKYLTPIFSPKPSNVFTVKPDVLWWELCKFPPEHCILIDSLSQASCNPRKQVAQFIWYLVARICWDFPNITSVTWVFWRQVCKFLRGWATEQLPRYSRSCEKICTICWKHWRPANHNIMQRSFFANGYQYRHKQWFTYLQSF